MRGRIPIIKGSIRANTSEARHAAIAARILITSHIGLTNLITNPSTISTLSGNEKDRSGKEKDQFGRQKFHFSLSHSRMMNGLKIIKPTMRGAPTEISRARGTAGIPVIVREAMHLKIPSYEVQGSKRCCNDRQRDEKQHGFSVI